MGSTMDQQQGKLFVGCFEFDRDDENSDFVEGGTFQIVVTANDHVKAAQKCRARLDAIADSSDSLGPIAVYLNYLVELSAENLANGAMVNLLQTSGDKETAMLAALPSAQGSLPGSNEYHMMDFDPSVPEEGPTEVYDEPPFWDGRESFRGKWKLFWCETDDHDEDWFMVARNEDEATQSHESAEGYDEGDAVAEFVCVLPGSVQGRYKVPRWPEKETLLACGAEYLPNLPQDGQSDLRKQMGSGARVVRIKGRVFGEGDIVGNTMRRMGLVEES